MSELEPRDRELVALGAAMGSNCVPCIEYHVPEARKAGLGEAQIREAVRLADRVRQVPARKVLETATRLLAEEKAAATPTQDDATPCGSAAPAAAGETPCCS